jgi:hypothetical protein
MDMITPISHGFSIDSKYRMTSRNFFFSQSVVYIKGIGLDMDVMPIDQKDWHYFCSIQAYPSIVSFSPAHFSKFCYPSWGLIRSPQKWGD